MIYLIIFYNKSPKKSSELLHNLESVVLCKATIFSLLSVKEAAKVSRTAGMSELAERLCLYLTDTLSGNIKFLTNLFKCAASAVVI